MERIPGFRKFVAASQRTYACPRTLERLSEIPIKDPTTHYLARKAHTTTSPTDTTGIAGAMGL